MDYALNRSLLSAVVASLLIGCGGGGSSSGNTDTTPNTAEQNTTQEPKADEENTTQGSTSSALTPIDLPDTPKNGEGKKLLAIYMIGSDLESEGEAGTSDLHELVAGYNTLTQEQKDSLDIAVAFGGANKEGWRGMKIANMEQIIKDANDGVFGNSDDYIHTATQANMGHKDTVAFFLNYLKSNFGSHSNKFLDMWDHGAGYGEFVGPDENHNFVLHTADAKEAFSAVGLKFDLIGFDTCLNGTLEVANLSKDFASYLVASEELEPGHGWNYKDVVEKFATAPDSITFGKNLVDSFLDTDGHVENRTLSLVDLSKYSELEASINKLADTLKTVDSDSDLKKAFIPAITNARGFNEDKEDNTIKHTMDVQHFATLLKANLYQNNNTQHAAYALSTDVIKATANYVLHSREDGTRPNSYGVAVFSINSNNYQSYGDRERLSQSWYDVVYAYANMGKSDTTNPIVVDESAQTTINMESVEKEYRELCSDYLNLELEDGTALKSEQECLALYGLEPLSGGKYRDVGTSLFGGESSAFINKNSKSKLRSTTPSMSVTTATFSDENMKNVRTIYGNILNGSFLATAIIEAKPMLDQNGTAQTYFTPIWNQKWYTFVYEEGKQSVWMPLMFKERHANGNVLYEAEIDYINSKKDYTNRPEDEKFDLARLEITVNSNNELVSHNIKPYTVEENNGTQRFVFAKTLGELKIGDQVRFYSQAFDMAQDEAFFNPEGDFVTLSKTFNLQVEELEFEDDNATALDYYYVMVAQDINGNSAFSTLQKAQKDSN